MPEKTRLDAQSRGARHGAAPCALLQGRKEHRRRTSVAGAVARAVSCAISCAAAAFFSASPAGAASVVATIENIPSDKGVLVMIVCSEATYQKSKCEHRIVEAARPGTIVLTAENVAPGDWGAFVLHDANENNKFDFKWYGAPREAYGASNNPPVRMGPARWRDIVFPVGEEDVRLSITLKGGR
ncbi:MAG: DUF2141 domain-containing protein [Pseudomonadota bacterium]